MFAGYVADIDSYVGHIVLLHADVHLDRTDRDLTLVCSLFCFSKYEEARISMLTRVGGIQLEILVR